MTVRLMITCLSDAFYGEVGIAATEVLEHLGHRVEFLEGQTCCGQPPFNSGDWARARTLAVRCADLFRGDTPVVAPSASCAAMVRHGYASLMRETPFRCFELCEFLVRECGVVRWPPTRRPGSPRQQRVAFHSSCHGRVIHLVNLQRDLLATVPGVEVVDVGEPEQCCGFGGAFAATHPNLSEGIGDRKLCHLAETGVDEVVGGDLGCLMHLEGLARRQGLDLRFRHVAEVLAEAIR